MEVDLESNVLFIIKLGELGQMIQLVKWFQIHSARSQVPYNFMTIPC